LVASGVRQHLLCKPAEEPGLRLGLRQPFHVHHGLRVPGHVSGYYLLEKIGSAETDVPQQIFLGTLVQSLFLILAAVIGGRLSDRTGRRKVFVLVASTIYGLSMFVIALASGFNGFLVGMAIGGLGFGMYVAVELALVVDVLPDKGNAAKDLGVFNFAGAVPFSLAPAVAPAILAVGGGSYSVLYLVAGACALLGAVAILPVKRVR